MSAKISKKRLGKIEKLASNIIDAWDLDTLVEYATEHMINSLSCLDKEEFDEEWDDHYGVEER